jgi:hypothetical protein
MNMVRASANLGEKKLLFGINRTILKGDDPAVFFFLGYK